MKDTQAAAVQAVAWMWQHEETGMTGFVQHAPEEELRQWERMNKPRKIVCALYSAPPSSVLEQAVKALEAMRPMLEQLAEVPATWALWSQGTSTPADLDGYRATLAALREALKPAAIAQQEQEGRASVEGDVR